MKIIECPRDAMQGITTFIPTMQKTAYLNQLLKVGFDTLDCGSFVSPKAIPQLKDTREVLSGLDRIGSDSKLLCIVANERGAEEAVSLPEMDYLGFPLSISETFQQRNTHRSIAEAMVQVAKIQNLCVQHQKTLVVYISMGFGNPYGEAYDEGIVADFVEQLHQLNIGIISLSDTIGVAEPEVIKRIFKKSITAYPTIEFGAHFHSTPDKTKEKIEAAYVAGCRRFDAAIKGFGGCPMAADALTGNVATETLIATLEDLGEEVNYNKDAFNQAQIMSLDVFAHA